MSISSFPAPGSSSDDGSLKPYVPSATVQAQIAGTPSTNTIDNDDDPTGFGQLQQLQAFVMNPNNFTSEDIDENIDSISDSVNTLFGSNSSVVISAQDLTFPDILESPTAAPLGSTSTTAALLQSLTTGTTVDATSGVVAPKKNTWLKGSILTALFVLNLQLLQVIKFMKQVELAVDIASMTRAMSLARDTASMVKRSAELQAWTYFTAAIGAAFGIALSAVVLRSAWNNISKQKSQFEAQTTNLNAKAAESKKNFQSTVDEHFSSGGPFHVNGKPLDVHGLKNNPDAFINQTIKTPKVVSGDPAVQAKSPEQAAIDALVAKVRPSAERYRTQQDQRDTHVESKSQIIGNAVQSAMLRANLFKALGDSINDFIKNLITGVLTLEKGNIDAAIEITRAERDMLIKQQDSAIESFRSLTDWVGKILQDLNKVVDALKQAFGSFRG